MRPFLLLATSLLALAAAPTFGRAEVRNLYGVAVIIGNKTYQNHDIPEVKYADRDAEAIKGYVIDVLGYSEDNIIFVPNATESNLLSIFGSADDPDGKLAKYLYNGGKSDVLIYYSGHGVPGLREGQAFLLPVDADPNTVSQTGYSLDLLKSNLEKLGARSVMVLLDACFSGGSAGGQLFGNASVMTRPASPMPSAGAGGITWIAASGADQLANWDTRHRHGLFTEYFLEAVYGRADDPQYGGHHDGKITLAAVHEYLDEEMSHVARRDIGRFQNATISGPPDFLVASLTPDALPLRHDSVAPTLAPSPAQQAMPAPALPAPVPQVAPAAPPPMSLPSPVVAGPKADEDALKLTNTDRRSVQQWLTALGHDTGGTDGVFGPASRTALSAYQRSIGMLATGYLTGDVFARIRRDGSARLEEIAKIKTTSTAQSPAQSTPTLALTLISGRYSVFPLGSPNTRVAGFVVRSNGQDFSIFGDGQNWTGQGRTAGQTGFYDWKFDDGKSGRTNFRINPDGTLLGHVVGSGLDWTYIAKRE